LSEVTLTAGIERIEAALLEMPQADIRTTHAFYPGRYERTIVIPPWTVLTGAIHKTPYRVRLERGSIAVNTDDGVQLLTAPFEFDAPAGAKRIGRVLGEEVTWVDIYDNPDNCTDVFTLEERLYVVPECGLGENRQLAQIDRDHEDYAKFLIQFGVSQAVMDQIVGTPDVIPMPAGFDVVLKDSRIHGLGLFAVKSFAAGELICPGRIDGHRTPAGRYINHSADPNTTSVKQGDDIAAVALRPIHPGEEILISYRTAVKVNFGIDLERLCPAG
jgi:hypothetical protein